MFERLFPRQFDNHYRGHRLGLWLLVPIVALRLLQGVNCLIDPRSIAMSADAIPLERFTADASGEIVLLFALSALSFLLFALQGIVVLVRYRSMIPLTYVWLVIDQVVRRALILTHPTIESASAGGHAIGFYINLALMAAMGLGLVLCFIDQGARAERA